MAARQNPFRIGGTVAGSYFTDRAAEVGRIAATLGERQAKLLVFGPRRMGKSSAIEAAARRLRPPGHGRSPAARTRQIPYSSGFHWEMRKITNSAGFTGAIPISITSWPASTCSGGFVSSSHFT